MGTVLLEEPCIPLFPSLARLVGVDEAILLQHLHFLLDRGDIRDGRRWVCNRYDEWQRHLSWWSARKIQRLFLGLEKRGYVVAAHFNRSPIDKTKWYRLDYDRLYRDLAGKPVRTDSPRFSSWQEWAAAMERLSRREKLRLLVDFVAQYNPSELQDKRSMKARIEALVKAMKTHETVLKYLWYAVASHPDSLCDLALYLYKKDMLRRRA